MARQSKYGGMLVLQVVQLFLYFVPIVTAVITLNYLGMTYSEEEVDMDPQDWRRKWLIFFAWVTLSVMLLRVFMTSLSLASKSKSK